MASLLRMRRFDGRGGYRKGRKMIEAEEPVSGAALHVFARNPIFRQSALLLLCFLGCLPHGVAQQPQSPAGAAEPSGDLLAVRMLIDTGHAAAALKQLDQM